MYQGDVKSISYASDIEDDVMKNKKENHIKFHEWNAPCQEAQ